jgi:antitoxin VapB
MQEMHIAKLFKNGVDQAVRLPAEFRFEGDEVYISRDKITGDVVLSSRPSAKIWSEFFDFMRSIDVPVDFMAERPMNVPPQARGVFDSEDV